MAIDHDLIEMRLKALEWRTSQLEAKQPVLTTQLTCKHSWAAHYYPHEPFPRVECVHCGVHSFDQNDRLSRLPHEIT